MTVKGLRAVHDMPLYKLMNLTDTEVLFTRTILAKLINFMSFTARNGCDIFQKSQNFNVDIALSVTINVMFSFWLIV